MKRFKNILVVSGQAEATLLVLARAVALARRNGARLTVVEAAAGLPRDMTTSVLKVSSEDFNADFARARQQQLEEQILAKMGGGFHPDIVVLIGTPFVEIIRAVHRNEHDLVMMATEGHQGLRGKLFGSTALHLMRKCPCPVWIMKSTHHKRFEGILAAVDPDPSDASKHAINIKIMDLATSLARQERSTLHVVHVWSPYTECFFGYSTMSTQQVEQVTQELQQQRRSEFDELLQESLPKDLDSQVHFLVDEPSSAISDLAAKLQIELIVMGTVCRTGLPGLFIGNTAENVLGQVDCSVLAVKPEGFVSPVNQSDM